MFEPEFRIISFGSPEYSRALRQRDKTMRQPLGLKLCAEDTKGEEQDIHMAGFIGKQQVCGLVLRSRHQLVWEIRQLYVCPEYQKQGIGSQLLSFAQKYAFALGCRRFYLCGRRSARDFYLKNGYSPVGSEYTEMQICHQDMRKDLQP